MRDEEPMPLEAMISRAVEAAHLGERTIWLQAQIAYEARQYHGVTANGWATEVGRSASWVRAAWRAIQAFGPDDRDPLLSYTIHAICASSTAPRAWLTRASEGSWSVADLREAMSLARADDTDELARSRGERILQRLRKWAEDVPARVRGEVARSARDWAAANC